MPAAKKIETPEVPETITITENQTADDRCTFITTSGKCIRPAGHNHGHMSQKVADNKKTNAAAKAKASAVETDPEVLAAKAAYDAAMAKAKIRANKALVVSLLAELEVDDDLLEAVKAELGIAEDAEVQA